MSAASPPTAGTPSPKSPPPSAPAASPNVPAHPRVGELHDSGTVRREFVAADRWFASGLVKVTGDTNVGQATVDGTVTLGGKLSADTVRYRGTLDVTGAVDSSTEFTGAGSLRAEAAFHAGAAELRGTASIAGPVSVDRALRVRGSLAAPTATAGELDVDGEVHIPGELSASRVTASLKENSAFGTVRARSVTLRGRPPNLVEKVFFKRVTVTVERVEADSADLESVEVLFVRAPQITLGRNAHVTEYEGTIVKRHPTSRVGFESKSPPPYGLRR